MPTLTPDAKAAAPQREASARVGDEGTRPYVVSLGGGRNLVLLLSPQHYDFDADGELLLRPAGVRHLDKVRAVAADVPDHPSPGWIKTMRSAFGMTQAELADALQVSLEVVTQWERGEAKPEKSAVQALRQLRRERCAAGVIVGA